LKASDHFSGHAADYSKYRPGYPESLFDWLATNAPARRLAWDCGCGNGQASVPLAGRFARVVATDLSPQQIAHATSHPRIAYRAGAAEDSGLPAGSCDLVAVAQALHWFDFDAFYAEVRRVLVPGGLLAAWTYQLLRAEPAVDEILADFYGRVLGPHWPPERRWVDLAYRGMPFPFADLDRPGFEIRLSWNLDDLLAYLSTWSAVQRCRQAEGRDPILPLGERLAPIWGLREERKEIVWPIALRAGRKEGGTS